MNYQILFVNDFTDGNIFPKKVTAGTKLEVTASQLSQVQQSGGMIEVLGQVVPPSNVKTAATAADKPTKAAPRGKA